MNVSKKIVMVGGGLVAIVVVAALIYYIYLLPYSGMVTIRGHILYNLRLLQALLIRAILIPRMPAKLMAKRKLFY